MIAFKQARERSSRECLTSILLVPNREKSTKGESRAPNGRISLLGNTKWQNVSLVASFTSLSVGHESHDLIRHLRSGVGLNTTTSRRRTQSSIWNLFQPWEETDIDFDSREVVSEWWLIFYLWRNDLISTMKMRIRRRSSEWSIGRWQPLPKWSARKVKVKREMSTAFRDEIELLRWWCEDVPLSRQSPSCCWNSKGWSQVRST
jgi:hypothetical protein